MEFDTGKFHSKRNQVIDYIKDQKNKGSFTVIDIGGEADSWASEIRDMIIDIKPMNSTNSMTLDICRSEDINKLLNYVKENGKFNYAICSHTLEDIYNPYIVMDNLPKIADEGVIFVPTCYTELSRVTPSAKWLGYIHHRYMFKEHDGKILVMAKMPFLEQLYDFKTIEEEFSVKWENNIEYIDIFNLYPYWDSRTMIESYEKALTR